MDCISDAIDDILISRCFSCKECMGPNETHNTLEEDPVCDYCWEDYQSECFQDQQAQMKAESNDL